MKSRATVLGHPLHQVLVTFPIGVFGFAAVCDVGRALARGRGSARSWYTAAQRAIGAGLVGALAAAPFGLIDFLAIPRRTRAKSVGLEHALGNACVGGLFLASYLLRKKSRAPSVATALSTAGLALAGVTAWLGGELVNRLGVGVYEPTSFDAPSTLKRPEGRKVVRMKTPREARA
jgi:uncharacterized membrane protein